MKKTEKQNCTSTVQDSMKALALCLKGVPLIKEGKTEEALSKMDESLSIDPTLASSWYNKGYLLSSQGKMEEAIEAYDKAIENDPHLAAAWNGKSYILGSLLRFDEALLASKQAIEIDPMFAFGFNGLGNALLGMNKYEEGLRAYNRSCELDKKGAHPWLTKALLLHDLDPSLETAELTAKQCFLRAVFLSHTEEQEFPVPVELLKDLATEMNYSLIAYRVLPDEDAHTACALSIAMLSTINSDKTLSNEDKNMFSGIINYYCGDPIAAREHFETVDSENESNMIAQYYILLSMSEFLEAREEETSFAVKQAKLVLDSDDADKAQAKYAQRILEAGPDSSLEAPLLNNLPDWKELTAQIEKTEGEALRKLLFEHLIK